MRKRVSLGCILVAGLAFLLCGSTASGQAVYGGIVGTVTDPQGNAVAGAKVTVTDRKSTRLNSSHSQISYAVFCLKKKKKILTAFSVTHPGRQFRTFVGYPLREHGTESPYRGSHAFMYTRILHAHVYCAAANTRTLSDA